MISTSSPTALAYNELYFISTSVPMAAPAPSVDVIFDEVSAEIFALFVAAPVLSETTETAGSVIAGLTL